MVDKYLFKFCAIGSGNVGKTSLIRRFATGKFTEGIYHPTLGVDITTSKHLSVDNKLVDLLLVDTAGQEYFSKLRPEYYRGASACLIVFALNERPSFEAIPDWLAEFRKYIPQSSVPIALVGNKKDLDDQRQVSTEEAYSWAEAKDMTYHETSAKLGGLDIKEIFTGLIRRIFQEN
ncbi:MAG: GTP-binding protein [Candidatus Heimdallarchaeota archaeon]|nr:MAG: GTP-binding protein [Candidatus Heimdallarchaeota archaeon]